MIIDTSALIAILFGEPEARAYARLIHDASSCSISAASFVELSIVLLHQSSLDSERECDLFFRRTGIHIEPFTADQAYLARRAFQDFGKGRHPAGLNFGDCFSYALAKLKSEPLLFKGDDFRKTDIFPAIS